MFTIRAYGILRRESSLLISKEIINSVAYTKFPGGGLEYGEGLKDCVIREIEEELGLVVIGLSHLYTTDFFVASIFGPEKKQVISVYYDLTVKDLGNLMYIPDHQLVTTNEKDQYVCWIPIKELEEEDLSFPIDQYVLRLIKTKRNISH